MTDDGERARVGPRPFERRIEFEWSRVLLFALAAAVVFTIGAAAVTSTTPFGPYNPAWDGVTDLHDEVKSDPTAESELVRTTDEYDAVDPAETVAFVVAPDKSYEGEDAERVASFVNDGGTLVVLENFGQDGNRLLANVGADARTDGRVLRDEQNHYRGPAMPIATGVENHTRTTSVEQLTLNYATAVDPGSENTTVLVTTSNVAYLGDENETIGQQTDLAAHPVATTENVSAGQVVVVGDPSIVINAMLDQRDNSAFVRELYADDERVLLDVSHVADLPPLTATVLLLRDMPMLQVLLGVTGIATIGALSRRRVRPHLDRVRRQFSTRPWSIDFEREVTDGGLSEKEQVELLRRKHPEWNDEQIQHVVKTVTRIQRSEEYDE